MTRLAWLATFGTTALAIALTLGSSILLARGLGPEGRGLLLALTVWPAILAGMFSLSLNEATSYHVARARMTAGERQADGYAATGFVLQCQSALLATLLTVAAIYTLPFEGKDGHLRAMVVYAFAFTPIMILDLHFKAVLQARSSYRILNQVRLSQPLVYVACMIALVKAGNLDVTMVMAATVVSMAIPLVVGAAYAGIGRLGAISREMMIATLSTGLKFHVGNILIASGAWVERILVVRLTDHAGVGYYAVAVAVASLGTGLIVPSLTVSLTGCMAAADTAAERAALLKQHLDLAAAAALIVNGSAIALAPWWMPFVFGAPFIPAVPVTMVYLVTGTIVTIRQVIDRGLRAAHIAKVGMAGEAVALVLLLPCALMGSQWAGTIGFAWGITASQGIALAVVVVLAARVLSTSSMSLIAFGPAGLVRTARMLGGGLAELRKGERK